MPGTGQNWRRRPGHRGDLRPAYRRAGDLADTGREIQFNALFLDPYLWKLQLGGKRLVQKARQSGAPIDGVVVSAGIPDLEDAVDLIDELNTVGITHVVFAGHRRADPLGDQDRGRGAHQTGDRSHRGRSRGWPPLVGRPGRFALTTYSELRARSNITVCVGGGIGTPERAADYLSGRWSQVYGYPLMPVDGILVGTAAMACLEATTSPSVKQMLVDTVGTDQWVAAGKALNGMASGAQPARRRHSRDRQRRLSLWPVARRCRRRRRCGGGSSRRDHRRDGGYRQALFRRRRRHDLPPVAPALHRIGHRRRRFHRRHQDRRLAMAGRHLARPFRGDAAARRGPAQHR